MTSIYFAVAAVQAAIALGTYRYFDTFRAKNADNRSTVISLQTLDFYPLLLGTSLQLFKKVDTVEGMQGTLEDARAALANTLPVTDFQERFKARLSQSALEASDHEEMERLLTAATQVLESVREADNTYGQAWTAAKRATPYLLVGAIVAAIAGVISDTTIFATFHATWDPQTTANYVAIGSAMFAIVGLMSIRDAATARHKFINIAETQSITVPDGDLDIIGLIRG